MVENREAQFHVPPDPFHIRVPNAFFFPLLHHQDCLAQVQDGETFSGEALRHFRESNRFLRGLNAVTSVVESALGARMVAAGSQEGASRRLSSVLGLLMLTHAATQVRGAFNKSLLQKKLDSKNTISMQDLTTK